MQLSSQFRKPSSPLKQTHPKNITSPRCVPIGCTGQEEMGSLHSLDNITCTTTYIHSTINTHNTVLQMVKVHINNTKHITNYGGQLIADVISNSDHITLNTNTPTRVPNTTLQQTSSPDITTVSNTLFNRTSWTTQQALS